MARARHTRRDCGFTLVELMVAMAIGVILMAAVYQFFIAQRRTYSTQDDVNRMQQDARVASTLITKAIQQTGAFSPTVGSTVSLRGQVILAASDHYLVLQADDPYRTDDNGIITADEVIAFAPSTAGGTATERIGDNPGVTNKTARTVRVFYDRDTPPDGVDADEGVNVEIPLALAGPPYTLYRMTPNPAGGTAPLSEEIASNVDNLVFRYYDQNGDRVLPIDPTTGNTLPAYQPLGATERALVRSVEMELTLRTRNADPEFTATFALDDNTVGTYDASGNPQTGISFVDDGFRRRTFSARVSPRNLSANSCGRITIVANPGQVPCSPPFSSTVTAALFDQFGDPVASQSMVFQLDPSSGASFSVLPTVTTTTTGTTSVNGEVSVDVYYEGLSQAVSVSAASEVDCRPTGPQRFTLQNAVAVDFVSGPADRLEISYTPAAINTYDSGDCATATGGTSIFTTEGYDTCGNVATPDPATTLTLTPSIGDLTDADVTQASQSITLTLPTPGSGAFSSLSAEVGVDAGSTWDPSSIAVTGTTTTTFTSPYSGALFSIPLRPWPPSAIEPAAGAWLAPFVPTPNPAWEDCSDLLLTSDPFQLVDCHDNSIGDSVAAPYTLTATVTGEGTATVSGPSGFDYTLQYELPGCTIPPAGSITDTVVVELSDGGTPLDTAGPQTIPVDGCATCAVTTIANPTLCEQRGTVSVGGCDLAGKTMDVVLTNPGTGTIASFSPPGTPLVESITHTFGTSPILLDVYFINPNASAQVTVTAYYPDQVSPQWQCSTQLSISTMCSNVELYSNISFLASAKVNSNILSCISDLTELNVEVEDCQIGTLGGAYSTLNEVRVQLEALVSGTWVTYDEEDIDLKPYTTNPSLLRSPGTGTASPDPNTPRPVEPDDGSNVSFDRVLRYPPATSLRIIVTYTDPVDGETCSTIVDTLTSPADVCFFNALASYNDADLPAALELHWGDVAVEGVVDLRANAPSVAKRSTATLTSTIEDRFLDVYVGLDSAGTGGYYQITTGDTNAGATRPFLLSDNLGNYFQHVSNNGIQTLAPKLNYDRIKQLAAGSDNYWYTESTPLGCTDGNAITNPSSGTTACITDVLQNASTQFVFVDTFGPNSFTGADIDAAATLPDFILGDLFTGTDRKLIYIAGSVKFVTAMASGQTLTLVSPPDADAHYLDNPLVGAPVWNPILTDLPIDPDPSRTTSATTANVNIHGGLYVDGQVEFDGSPVIYGAVIAERGVTYTGGGPQIWYDYGLRSAASGACTTCGTRPITTCGLTVSPTAVSVEQNLRSSVTVSGVLGTLSASTGDSSVATYDLASSEVLGVGVGTTTVTLADTLQPLCPVVIGVTVTPCVLNPQASPSSNLDLGNTATVVVSQPVTWAVIGSSAISLNTVQPQSTNVVGSQVGSATLRATGSGLGCSDDVPFTVNCALAVAPATASLLVGGSPATVTVSGASSPLTLGNWTVPAAVQLTAVTGDTFDITGLTATTGSVPVTVSDPMDPTCTATTDVTVANPSCNLAVTSTDMTIGVGGTPATVTASGANATVTWAWSSTDGGTATLSTTTGAVTDVSGTMAGTVTVTATDSLPSGCTAAVDIAVNPACTLAVTSSTASIDVGGAAATLTASGASGAVSWAQTAGTGVVSLSPTTGNATDASGTTAGPVTITATDSGLSGCTVDTGLTVNPPTCLDLAILSPADGDSYGGNTANGTSMVWEGYPDDLDGTNIRDDIDHLEFRVFDPSGTEIHFQREGIYGYCGFGGNTCSASPGNVGGWVNGVHTLEVIAFTKSSHPCGITSTTRTIQITIDN